MGSPVAVPIPRPEPVAASTAGAAVDGGGNIDAGAIDAGAPPTNAGPQTFTFDRTAKFVAVPNYYSGYVYMYDVASDQSIKSLVAWHTAGNNAHNAAFTLNNNYMFVRIWARNLIEVYGFDATTGQITAKSSTTLPSANSGPRHIALHSQRQVAVLDQRDRGRHHVGRGQHRLLHGRPDRPAPSTSRPRFAVPIADGLLGCQEWCQRSKSCPWAACSSCPCASTAVAEGSLVSFSINATTGAPDP